MVTKEELYNFENWCVETYKEGKLRSPLHLSGSTEGNLEEFLIELFKEIKPQDYVFSTYRSHYHALLKGIPEEWLKDWILDNKSIHVMNREHNFLTSAIVGGTLSNALGVAIAIKIKDERHEYEYDATNHETQSDYTVKKVPHVWVFVGDMTSTTGTFHEVWKFAYFYNLPITFVIEDNGLSTDTVTKEAWNGNVIIDKAPNIKYIKYTRKYPHYGCGVFVDFKEEGLTQDGKTF